tara:strand:+ start:1570 stop:2916 length:1347 start_codon:yes stop_codon:yes gene_type:complete
MKYNFFKKKIIDIESFLTKRNVKSLILSISGGADSVFLLHLLLKIRKKYPFEIILYYVNYNMNSNSLKAFNLIRNYSKLNNIKLLCDSIKLKSINFESNARDFRYSKLNKILNDNSSDLVLTAHHFDDQIETLLMKKEDGADWISFLGIRRKYNYLYRPLLNIHKSSIIDFLINNKIKWTEDKSNEDLKYRRNQVRKLLKDNYYSKSIINDALQLHEKSKKMIKSFDLKYNEKLLKFVSKSFFNSILIESDCFKYISSIEEFKLFITRVLSQKLNYHDIKCSRLHWINIKKTMINSNQGAKISISGNLEVSKDRSTIIIYNNNKINNDFKVKLASNKVSWYNTTFSLSFNSNSVSKVNPESIVMPSKLLNKGLYVTHWKFGDKIVSRDNSRKISDLFINSKISNYHKKYYPVIRDDNDNILWIPKIAGYNYDCVNKDSYCLINWSCNE